VALQPEERICAYAGLVDGLNKKPWTRLAINSPDMLQFRFDPNGNPLVVSNTHDGLSRSMPSQPVFQPMQNDYRAIQVAAHLDHYTDVLRGADLNELGQIGQVLNGIQSLERGADMLRGVGVPIPNIPGIPYLPSGGGFSIPGLGGFR
jgi:hypothetical protein